MMEMQEHRMMQTFALSCEHELGALLHNQDRSAPLPLCPRTRKTHGVMEPEHTETAQRPQVSLGTAALQEAGTLRGTVAVDKQCSRSRSGSAGIGCSLHAMLWGPPHLSWLLSSSSQPGLPQLQPCKSPRSSRAPHCCYPPHNCTFAPLQQRNHDIWMMRPQPSCLHSSTVTEVTHSPPKQHVIPKQGTSPSTQPLRH